VATRILAVEDGTVRSYHGGWADLVRARAEAEPPLPEPESKLPPRRKRTGRREPKAPGELERVEAEISAREARIAALERSLLENWTDVDLIAAHRRERDELTALLERWEKLFEQAQA
jgi:hypothetical protein